MISLELFQAAYSKDGRISKVALTSIHDVMSELLKRRNELPHFWFYDVMFKPFELLMGVHNSDEDFQDQVYWMISYNRQNCYKIHEYPIVRMCHV